MKDYSTNDFQRKSFITGYNITLEDKKIIIYYADGTQGQMDLSTHNIRWILSQMRKQITDYSKVYDEEKLKLDAAEDWKHIYNIIPFIFLLLIILMVANFTPTFIPFILVYTGYSLACQKLKKDLKPYISKLQSTIDDYEKSLYFVENSPVFANPVISYEAIMECPKILATIQDSVLLDGILKGDEVTAFSIIDVAAYQDATSDKAKEQIESLEVDGYRDISDVEYPIINENSIESFSIDDLKRIESGNKGNRGGRVLVKTSSSN